MTDHAHAPLDPHHRQSELSLLEEMRAMTQRSAEVVKDLQTALNRVLTPPERMVFRLTSAMQKVQVPADEVALAVTIYNPSGVTLYAGLGGETPAANMNALEVPPGSVVTWPGRSRDFVIGIDPADAAQIPAQGIQVDVVRHWTPQPPQVSRLDIPKVEKVATPGTFTFPAVATTVKLANANPNRKYFRIRAGGSLMYVQLGAGLGAGVGIPLSSGQVWEMPSWAPYVGEIWLNVDASGSSHHTEY